MAESVLPGPKHPGLPVGIVGAGLMGRWHAQAAERAGATVVSIADPDAAALARLSRSHPRARTYESANDLIDGGGLHALHLCSPLHTHVDVAVRALESGLHVLVEKPLAPDGVQTQRLLDEASARSLVLIPVHQFLFQHGVERARGLFTGLGRIVRMEMSIQSAGGEGRTPAEQQQIVADILPHPLSLFEEFLPQGLDGASWSAADRPAGELDATARVGDTALSIHVSLSGRPTHCRFTVVGTSGSAEMDLFHGYSVVHRGDVSRRTKITAPFVQNSGRLMRAGTNLIRRAFRRETAYPGLRELVSRFHAAAAGTRPSPLSAHHIRSVALERDHLIQCAGLGVGQ